MEPGIWLLLALLATLVVLVILQVRHSKKEREEREWAEMAAKRGTTGYPTTSYPTTSYPTTSYSTTSYPTGSGAAPVVKVRMTHTATPKAKTVSRSAGQPASAQLTLYQQPPVTGKLVCPGCEGENDSSYCFCLICGQRIR